MFESDNFESGLVRSIRLASEERQLRAERKARVKTLLAEKQRGDPAATEEIRRLRSLDDDE